MQRLPRLVLDRVAWRLPITDSTASRLLHLVSVPWTGESTQRLESILVADALVTTWFSLRIRSQFNVTFGAHLDLAKWLSRDRLLDQLEWVDAGDAAPFRADEMILQNWSELSAAANRILAPNETSSTDRAYFRRSLSCGAKWFGSCCLRAEYLSDGPFLDRLVGRFTELGAAVTSNDILASNRSDAYGTSPITLHARHNVDHGEWTNQQIVAPLLPAIFAQTRRLALLEKDFACQLKDAKLKSLQELAYGASHEINNPLANISARAQTLLVDESDPARRKKLLAINRQAFRAHDMIADMMLFAKPPRLCPQPVQVAHVIDDVIGGLRDRTMECRVRIEQKLDDAIPEIAADPNQLRVALHSILQNSIEAIQEDGLIIVSASSIGVPPNHHAVTIRVQDSGPGIPEDTKLHIFDPFFSGREAGRGLGFGLSKAWRIVHEHGGRLDVENVSNGSGTVFTMRVPSQAS